MRIKQTNGYEFKSIAFFLTVAREQSFTKAARQLNITQPTLSRQRGGRGKEHDRLRRIFKLRRWNSRA